ncbi:MAG: UbiA-like polyprenyltransferase [Nitrospinota bacterium]
MHSLKLILKDIRIEHTLFAMPFAIMSAFLAAGGLPEIKKLALLLIALFFARSAAMAFNRITDAKFDAANPRTKQRPLAAGGINMSRYVLFVCISSAFFIGTCYALNPLAFTLSPAALFIIFFYSFTKRFTLYSHFFLGIALSLAPIGAWVAVKGEFGLASVLLGAAVVFWLVGLDIIYSCQDVEHDKSAGLHSIPSRLGMDSALRLSSLAHAAMIVFLLSVFFISTELGPVYLAGVALTAGLLFYEHSLVKPDDLRKVNTAFFNVNGMISVGLMAFTVADTLLK